jgi:hypothetical protein
MKENTMSALPKDYTGVPGAGAGAITLVDPGSMPNAPVVIGAAPSRMEVLSGIVSKLNGDVDKVERIMVMVQEAEAKDAERSFNSALRRCQTRMGPISTNAANPETRSKYADYYALDAVVRPIYTEEGFAVTFSTADAGPEAIKVLGWLLHDGGHSRQYEITMPADGKGAKGGNVMSKTHATGAAMTYGKRYLLVDMFNLAIDKDDDGNGAGINDAQVTAIFKLIKDTGTDEAVFCSYFKIPMVADLSRKDYQRAADYLRRKSGTPQITPEYLK